MTGEMHGRRRPGDDELLETPPEGLLPVEVELLRQRTEMRRAAAARALEGGRFRRRIVPPLAVGSAVLFGSGLGLAIVKAVAEGHGGTIDIGDSRLGGCRVTVRLPRSGVTEVL